MMTPVVNVTLIDFSAPGSEIVLPNEDNSYTILINARLSAKAQAQSYSHAMRHIVYQDFEKANVQTIEAAAHSPVSTPDACRADLRMIAAALRRGLRSQEEIADFLCVTEEFLCAAIEGYRQKYGQYVRVGDDILLLEPTVGLLSMKDDF